MFDTREGVRGVELAVRAALDLLLTAPASAFEVGPGEGAESAQVAQLLIERLCALRADAVAAVEAEGAWRTTGATSVGAWTRDALGLTGAEAGTVVRTSRAVHSALPLTREALWAGALTWAHVTTLARQALATPARRAAVAEPGGERTLVEIGRSVAPHDLRQVLASWAHGVDAAGVVAEEQELFAQRRVTLASTLDGMWHLEGLLDPIGGAALAAALDSVVRAGLGAAGEERTVVQLRADALVDLARASLDAGAVPRAGGIRPHVLLHISSDTLEGRPGAPPAELGPGRLALSGVLARMLACDATVTPVVWTPTGRVLDLGRTTRTVPPWLRLAVIARDHGCVFPGCGRAAIWCDCHHVVWWSRGGETSLAGLCLLCRYHHRMVHEYDLAITHSAEDSGWQFTFPDGTPMRGPPSRWRGQGRRRRSGAEVSCAGCE